MTRRGPLEPISALQMREDFALKKFFDQREIIPLEFCKSGYEPT